jgi:hypothetical protein
MLGLDKATTRDTHAHFDARTVSKEYLSILEGWMDREVTGGCIGPTKGAQRETKRREGGEIEIEGGRGRGRGRGREGEGAIERVGFCALVCIEGGISRCLLARFLTGFEGVLQLTSQYAGGMALSSCLRGVKTERTARAKTFGKALPSLGFGVQGLARRNARQDQGQSLL